MFSFTRCPAARVLAARSVAARPVVVYGGVRAVASSVSNRPASQTLPHAMLNAREEAGNSAVDLAKTIAGNVGAHVVPDARPVTDSFFSITSAIAAHVPRHVLAMGLAGALPYLGTSATTIYLARQAGLAAAGAGTLDPGAAAALLDACMHVQITYGAVLISFAGALHWGMEFAAYNGYKGYPRLLLGATPVVFAWSTLALNPVPALIAQWFGYTGLWYADMRATSAGWTPKWYSQYRFYLSILVGSCIFSTVAGTIALGPSAGHDATHHALEQLRAARHDTAAVPGAIEAVATGSAGDAYVRISKKKEGEQQ